MKGTILVGIATALLLPAIATAQTRPQPGLGTEEFGMSQRELVQAIERTEQSIARCMREQGFQYVAADYNTVRQGMSADKSLPGQSEEDFIARYGFAWLTVEGVSLCAIATQRAPRFCQTLIEFTGDGDRWPLHSCFPLEEYVSTTRPLPTSVVIG